MNRAYLLLGSNLSDPWQQLHTARKKISMCVDIITKSSIYETKAWGKTDQPDFLNQVILVSTELSPEDLLNKLLAIEGGMGRARSEKNAPRLIDIDILFYNSSIIKAEHLSVPHPRITERRFVLIPLHEIAPKYMHPVLNKSIGELLGQCVDPLQVKRY